jgi:hypothetical protein
MRVSKEKLENQGVWAEGLGPEYDDYKEMFALDNLVDVFTGEQLKGRLHQKVEEGKKGWDDPETDYDFEALISQAAGAGKWVDVAVYAMLAWNDEQPDEDISPQDLPAQPDGPETFAGASPPVSFDGDGTAIRGLEARPEGIENEAEGPGGRSRGH